MSRTCEYRQVQEQAVSKFFIVADDVSSAIATVSSAKRIPGEGGWVISLRLAV